MATNSDNKPTNAITESVLAVNQIVLGSGAPTAMAALYVSMGHAAGIGAQNSVSNQQHLNILGTAAIAAATGNLLWEGIQNEVSEIPMQDRLNYWQQLMDGKASAKEGDGEKTSEAEDKKPAPKAEEEDV
ncbi:MAG: RebB family R body protein [Sneathiella sp.]